MNPVPGTLRTPSILVRIVVAASLLSLGILAACGGKQSGGSGGSGGVYDEDEPDGATCVNLDTASFDQSCEKDSDCVAVAGEGSDDGGFGNPFNGVLFCNGYCGCLLATINVSAQAGYEAALSPVTSGICSCPAVTPPSCKNHLCTMSLCDINDAAPGCPS
jgi:hypothetical protein